MRPIKLTVCRPIYDRGENQYYNSWSKLIVPGRAPTPDGEKIPGETIVMLKEDHPIQGARTILTQEVLDYTPDADYVLWIDDDMTFAPDAAMRLIKQAEEANLDIVGGLCFNRRHPYGPTLFKRHPEAVARSGYGICYSYPRGELFQVDATGYGFILVRTDVYKEMRKVRGDTWYMPIKEEFSEDLAFCARAKLLGYEVWVDTSVKIGHIGKVVIDEDFADRNRQFEHEFYWNPDDLKVDKSDEPQASIVIPVYNQDPKFFNAAVISACGQNVPVEVIVVDDGSGVPVELPSICENARLIRIPVNRGIANALNIGIGAMETDWFCWLSSDDLFDPRKVKYQLSVAHQSGAKALFTRYQIATDGKGFARTPNMPAWTNHEQQKATLAEYCAIFGSTIMVHREVIEKVGFFDDAFQYGQDWEWFCRVAEEYHWQGLDNLLVTRREQNNLTAEIAEDEKKTRVRDLEDDRIRSMYRKGPKWSDY